VAQAVAHSPLVVKGSLETHCCCWVELQAQICGPEVQFALSVQVVELLKTTVKLNALEQVPFTPANRHPSQELQ